MPKGMTMISRAALFLVMVAMSSWGQAQDYTNMDEKSRSEVGDLRAIANAIKACPRIAEWQDTGIGTIYDGPPSNVVWDVKPAQSVRAPYLGFIEFFLPRDFSAPAKHCAKNPNYCAAVIDATKPFRYRFEFDLGPEGLELTKLLVKSSGQSPDQQWSDARPDKSCWQAAAQSHKGKE